MKTSLQLNIKQSVSLSPKLQQAIRLLQLSTQELETEIQAAIQANPLLELEHQSEDFTPEFNTADLNYEFTNNIAHPQDLHDYLVWQLNLTSFSERDEIIAVNIIDYINEEGYLQADLEDIFLNLRSQYNFANLDFKEVLAVLHRVQQFDPPGVAARNLGECMLLQLQALDIEKAMLQSCAIIINNHLQLLANKDYDRLQKNLNIDHETLCIAIAKIKSLNPKPGLIFSADQIEYIIPDVIAEQVNDRWQIYLNPNAQPKLRINTNYALIMKQSKHSSESQTLRQQYSEAQWLIDSIKNRNNTLLKVANFLVQYQADFLQHGAEKMRPLILQDVAVALDLSESTISRITTKKYLHTKRGTFELKFFFSNNIAGDSGELCSSIAVKSIIKQLIAGENSPISDQGISDLLATRGIIIARRTIAKYRESLGILPSKQRRF